MVQSRQNWHRDNPHRGFETVTIAYHGKVAHHDSKGHSGVIGEGDVQWVTAVEWYSCCRGFGKGE
jgi:redox-sensitive bicupin YhaK (pirin superfamily)